MAARFSGELVGTLKVNAGAVATEITISLVTVTLDCAELVGSDLLVAEIVTLVEDGRSAGAVYSPVASIVPRPALPPVTPFTAHVTGTTDDPVALTENC